MSMTASEAYNKFMSDHEELTVLSCYEFDSRFVFEAVSDNFVGTDAQNMVFDSQFSVDKSNGVVSPFKPFDIPSDEYNRGKKVLIKEIQNHKFTANKQ